MGKWEKEHFSNPISVFMLPQGIEQRIESHKLKAPPI